MGKNRVSFDGGQEEPLPKECALTREEDGSRYRIGVETQVDYAAVLPEVGQTVSGNACAIRRKVW